MSSSSAPGPRSILPGANLLPMRRDALGFFTRLAREYGDVVQFRLGTERIFLLNNPDDIKDVLVTNHRLFAKGRGLERAKRLLGEGLLTSEGEFHRRQRRLAQPAFHRDRIDSYGIVMAEYAARQGDQWRDGVELDLHKEMLRLTLAIVGKTLFGADIESEAAEIGAALATSLELFQSLTLPFAELLEHLPLPATLRFRRAKARLDKTVLRMIREHRERGADRGDLLSMLLISQDEEEPAGGMSDLQLRDEAMTIFLAGHETTANAATWALVLLSQHIEAQRGVEAEVDAVLQDRLPRTTDLSRLTYTTQVLAEAIRLYPPAWIIGRRALEDYEVGGYRVPARSILLMSQYVTHRDPRYYPEPSQFDPARWTDDVALGWPWRGRPAVQGRTSRPYFPFGAGPRVCIGEQFAWMEGVLILATLARRWRLQLVPGQVVEPLPSVTLRPKNGARMVPLLRM